MDVAACMSWTEDVVGTNRTICENLLLNYLAFYRGSRTNKSTRKLSIIYFNAKVSYWHVVGRYEVLLVMDGWHYCRAEVWENRQWDGIFLYVSITELFLKWHHHELLFSGWMVVIKQQKHEWIQLTEKTMEVETRLL